MMKEKMLEDLEDKTVRQENAKTTLQEELSLIKFTCKGSIIFSEAHF